METKEELLESLSANEIKILPLLSEKRISELIKKSGLEEVAVLRTLDFLANKKLVELKKSEKKTIELGKNGILYKQKCLPERRLVNLLAEKKSLTIEEAKKQSNLDNNEFQAALGVLKKKALLEMKNQELKFNGTKEEISKKTLEEQFLDSLPINLEELKPEQKFSFDQLKNRKDIIQLTAKNKIEFSITELGKQIIKQAETSKLKQRDLIESLTPEIIQSQQWKTKKFRRYDISSHVPRIFGGKRHFVNRSVDYGKRIWLDLGFKEMISPKADSSFWIFDSLFTAQDHPVREMQDTFFIKKLKAKLPDKKLVEAVKKAHEQGVGGSKGWQYNWNEETSKRIVLRTHTTGASARTLANLKKEDLPAKFFALGKVFRNETVDWKHGFEFYQTEGIVIDENANFRNLLGYLKEFYKKMGFEKIKFVPSFFPYTEPSVEIQVWHNERKEWLEFGGAGIFRPEVTIPLLGTPIPVLAWGQGFDRIIMEANRIKDLRELYSNNLNLLRERSLAH